MSNGHPYIAISEGLEVMDVKPGSGENKTWYPVVRLEFCVIQVSILSDTTEHACKFDPLKHFDRSSWCCLHPLKLTICENETYPSSSSC